MRTLRPRVLLVSSKHDYSTDHVALELHRIGASYLRLNRDQLSDFKVRLVPTEQKLAGESQDFCFEVGPRTLRSVYFRAPAYLRDTYQPGLSPDEQLSRTQWAAFIRSLTVFDDVFWVNHPRATYQAEIKPYQLYLAKRLGFEVPETCVTNTPNDHPGARENKPRLAMKTLDPAILNIGEQEAFIYTSIISSDELCRSFISSAPTVLQEALLPKIDLRVTVIGKQAFAATIKSGRAGIGGDWRLQKDSVEYHRARLPAQVRQRCVAIVKHLGLMFGAIDLALHKGKYYFLEINPTGEWAWLMHHTGLPLDRELARLLTKRRRGERGSRGCLR